MKLQERIDEISSMGANRTKVEINVLIKDVTAAISHHFAISEEDLMNVVEDEL